MSIIGVPLELMLEIGGHLQPDDIVNLSLTAKKLNYVTKFKALCKKVLMVSGSFWSSFPKKLRARRVLAH